MYQREQKVIKTGHRVPAEFVMDPPLEEAGFETLTYETQWRQYRLRIDSSVADKQRDTLLKLIRQAREGFGKAV